MAGESSIEPQQLVYLHACFDNVADQYRQAVEPALAPLAEDLVEYAHLRPEDLIIDLGTGSGLVARRVTSVNRSVVALDFSLKMLEVARGQGTPNLMCGDMHRLAIGSDTFDVALAAFAFNSTDPFLSMTETWRILVPGGRLIIQEWGKLDPLSELLTDTVANYAVEHPPPDLAALRAAVEIPHPWDDMESIEDMVDALKQTGFEKVKHDVVISSICMPTVDSFIRYKLTWPVRRAELEAMPEEIRYLCLSDLRENLAVHAGSNGQLIWQPEIVRFQAYKPT